MRYDFRNLIFRELIDEELEELLETCSRKVSVPKKKIFHVAGDELDGLYYIRTGVVMLYMCDKNGAEKTLYRLSRGWFFGETVGLLGLGRTSLHFQACEKLQMYCIDKARVDRLLADSKKFRDALIMCSCYKTLALRYEIGNFTYCSAKTRLLKSLYRDVDDSEIIDGQWHPLSEKRTHYELGVDIGASRVTISRLVGVLCRECHLRVVNNQLQFSSDLYRTMTSETFDHGFFANDFS